ncbi:MAG: flagellar basal body L-ring protein FlgH [Phycisphaerales bacterium]|nr:flagellar basal body L-ring protein FlgH [Phycisphaerales bacterium]
MKHTTTTRLTALAILSIPTAASAQSLFQRQAEVATTPDGKPDPQAPIREMSLTYTEAPPPRSIQINDLITIIIDETSKQKSEQVLDNKKDYDWAAAIKKFPSLKHMIDGELQTGDSDPVVELELGNHNKFKGDGSFERTDRFSARIQAKVIDVKPNGTLVLEASKMIASGEEKQSIVLSGVCRKEDITDANTLLSTQLADLTIITKQEGEVKDTATKGLIPKVLETLFNF